MLTSRDIGWIAGFLEGEGSFGYHRSATGGAPVVQATQVQREPVDRLKALLGGHIYFKRAHPPSQASYQWRASGPLAVGVMMMVHELMSPRRREQIHASLAPWRATRPDFKYRTHCKQGHVYDEINTRRYINFNGNPARDCRRCHREIFGPRATARRKKRRLVLALLGAS